MPVRSPNTHSEAALPKDPSTASSGSPVASGSARREDLLRGATLAFLEGGFQATTMQRVADACGVGKGTLYEYFSSKEDLFIEVCLSDFDPDSESIEETFRKSEDPAGTLTFVFDAILDGVPTILERMPLYFTLWARLSYDARYREPCHQGMRDLYRGFREALARGIARAQEREAIRKDLDPRDMASVLMCAIDGYTYLQVFSGREVDFDRLRATLRTMLFDGMELDVSAIDGRNDDSQDR